MWGLLADEAGQGQIAGEGFANESADDDLFVGGGHEAGNRSEDCLGIVARRCRRNQKGAKKVVNSLTLCYSDLLRLTGMMFLNT